MDNIWERTLVDWVNCLKLQKPISNLDELKDGIFFKNLQKVMKSPEVVNTDVLTCIFHIFKKHYPKLTIYERINVHLTDLKNDELKLLTSMLMHYTCIYDRQDVLTSPLCHSLKAQTQTSIKFFLEKVQECPSLTNDDLMKIIQQCTEENMEQPNCLNFMANSADASKESPLYDIFKTPMSKRIKIFEKDKEISHLKATLEVAQEEKDDLEDVLKRHVERNKKLEKQLEQKNAEISRLKSEIVALENRTPPHFRDIDAVETERILKTQIDSLEKIIERCDIENQELQDDRNSEKTRAKMFESQCKTWMEKFLDAEKKLQSLTEHSDEQESKLNSLKKHCEELEALLQEYKPKNSGEESFIEDSFQLAPATKRRSDNYTSLEDLAHSVVDLQLKEKEKENEEFRSALDDTRRRLEDAMKENANCRNEIETLTNENGDLKDQLQKVVTEYDIMNNKMEEALRENDKFRSEIEILRAENENLKCQKEQLMMKYTELTHQKETIQRKLEEYIQICDEAHKKLEDALIENRLCQSEIETLKVKHENLQDQVEQMRSENTDLNNRYEAMERELEVYVQTCRILENNLENLKIEKEQLSEEKVQILEDLVDSVTKLKLSKVELENVTKEKELVDTDLQEAMSKCNDLEKNLEKLSEHSEAMQKTNNHLQEKIASLESALVQVNQGKDNLESKIEEIESAIVKRDETIEQMKQELNSLEEHNQAIEFENAELKTCKDKVNRTLKSFCGSYRQQLHSLKNEKINLQKNTKSTLENIAYILRTLYKETGELLAEKYECSLKLKEEIEEKTKALSNLEKMKNDNNDVSRQLDESNQANLELKHEIGRLTSKCDALLIELDETRSDMDERILGYEKNVAHLSSQIASLENEKQEAEAERIRLMEELNRAEAELEQFIENCNKLTKENSSLQEGVSSLKLKLDEESSMNNEYVQRVENLTADQATLAEKYQVTIKEKDLLSQMLCEISTEKDVLEGKLRKTTLELQNTISQNMDAISKLEQTLAEQRDKLDSVLNEKLELSSELDALTKEFEETTEKNSELCKSMKNDMNQLRSEKDHMITENENISRALQEQQQSFESLKSRYDESSEKCQQLLAEKELLAHELSEITAVKEGLEIQLKSLEQTIVKFEVKTIELTNSLDIKTDEYHRCADERDELKLEIDKRESDLQHLLSEKEMVKAKLDSQLEECYRKNEELTKQLSEVSTQKDELEVELGDLKQKMHENQEVTKKLDNEITELNQKLDANNKDYQASLNERQHLSNQVSELVSERDSLGVQMAELKLELEKLFSEKQDLQVVLEREIGNLESKLIITETDYQNIKEEKDQLTDQVSVMYSEKTFLESELSTLKVDLQNLLFESKENTNRFEELLKKLKNEMETLNGEKCSLTEELQDQKKAFSSHREKCFAEQQFISNEVVILRDQHSQLSDQVKQFIEETKNVEVVKKLIHDILERYTETCSLVTKLQSENEQLNVENKNISEEFRNAKLHIDVILQKKDGLEKKIEVLQLDSLKLQQRLCDRERELELVTTENEQVRKNHLADSESFNKQTKFYEEEILKTVLENTELKKYKNKVSDELKNYVDFCKKYKQDISDLKTQNSQVVNNMSSTFDEMTEALRTLAIEANNLAGDKKKLTNQLNKITQEKFKLENVIEEMNCEHTTLIHELENVISDKNIKLKECEKMLYKKTDKLKSASLEKQELELKKDEMNEKLLNAVNKITHLDSEVEKLHLEVCEYKKIKDQLQQEKAEDIKNLEYASIQKNILEQELQEAISSNECLKKDLETIKEGKGKEIAIISTKLESSEKQYCELLEEKEILKKELQIYIDSCNNLVKQIEELKSEKQQLLKESEIHLKQIECLANMDQMNKEQIDKAAKEKEELSVKLEAIESEKSDILSSSEAVVAEKNVATNTLMYISNKIQELSDKLELTSNMQTSVQNIEQLDCQKIFENLNAISGKMDVMLKERDVFEVVDKLSEEKADLIQTLEITMSDLRKALYEKTNLAESLDSVTKELDKLSIEKHNLCEELEMQRRELVKVKKERNDILESQAAVLKETESNIRLAHESAVDIKNDLSRRIDVLEKEKQNVKKHLEADLQRIREAYSKVVSTNSKLELETVNLRRKIEEKNERLTDYTQIKEAYEKLLEENSKLMTEVDTLKYKRSRDREEFVNIVKKERAEAVQRENRKIREIKNEYEKKLEKMKERMLNLYKEEVNKGMQKVKDGHDESTFLHRTVEDLRQSLAEAEEKVQLLETELEMFKIKEAQMQKVTFASRDSIRSVNDLPLDSIRPSGSLQSLGRGDRMMPAPSSTQLSRKVKSAAIMQSVSQKVTNNVQDRKLSTLPRARVDIEETVTVSRRTSIGVERVGQNLEMEDEEDDFNNKYLADLKAGRCAIAYGNGSNANRMSELAWRNSLVPPHLKSSYPAETQFISPGHFKEDDIKTGNIELDDSLCKLLPGEKPRQKKDFGTTSYKKPGPPTPSRNGGRLSLQGNEVQPLRDHNERTPKKTTTPSRIKALFMGKTSSKENSDSQNITPGSNRRLSIFRKQKQ